MGLLKAGSSFGLGGGGEGRDVHVSRGDSVGLQEADGLTAHGLESLGGDGIAGGGIDELVKSFAMNEAEVASPGEISEEGERAEALGEAVVWSMEGAGGEVVQVRGAGEIDGEERDQHGVAGDLADGPRHGRAGAPIRVGAP